MNKRTNERLNTTYKGWELKRTNERAILKYEGLELNRTTSVNKVAFFAAGWQGRI